MLRTTCVLRLSLLLVAGLVGAAAGGEKARPAPVSAPAAGGRVDHHSGLVKTVDVAHQTLELEEMGPWTGPGTGLITRSIGLTPATNVRLVQRSQGASDGGWIGGYAQSPLRVEDLRAGDFATVSTVRRGRHLVAVSIDILRPSGD